MPDISGKKYSLEDVKKKMEYCFVFEQYLPVCPSVGGTLSGIEEFC
jgi:hypothetical protein